MRSRERLRRIERGIAEVEVANYASHMSHAQSVHVMKLIVVAELEAAACVMAIIPAKAAEQLEHTSDAVVATLRDLQAATGETGQVFKATVTRLIGEARERSDKPKERAACFEQLVRAVTTRWRAPQH